jgi:hypothetical protein
LPSEEHIRRQIEWSERLQPFYDVKLEEDMRIEGARVVVDVVAKYYDKTFLIEVGDINDDRKYALMKIYAENDPDVTFIHEPYGADKINQVLESLDAYRNSAEYKALKRREHVKQLKEKKRQKRDVNIRLTGLFLAVFSFLLLYFSLCDVYWLYEMIAIPLWLIMIVSAFIFLKPFLDFLSGNIIIASKIKLKDDELKLNYDCPQCGQPCTKEEYESGYCLDCDQIEMNLFEES